MSINRKTKIAIFIAIVVIMLLSLSACGQQKFGPNTGKFLKIIESGNFFAIGTVTEDGETVKMEMYVRGDEGVVVIEVDGMKLRTIALTDKTYVINETERMMIVTPTEEVMSMLDMDFKDIKYLGSGTATFDGKLLTYDEYESGSTFEDNTTERVYYFVDGGRFAGWRSFMSSGETVDLVLSDFGRNYPKSVFDIPTEGYEVINW